MFLSKSTIIIMCIGNVLSVLFLILLFAGKKYASFIEPLNNKEFPLCGIYGFGFVLLEILKHSYASKNERKRCQFLTLIYGSKHAEYYLRVNAAERVSIASLLVILGFILYGLTNNLAIIVIFIVFAGTAYYYIANLPKTKLTKRNEEMLNDFSEVVSKLALLVNAGVIMKEAWEKTAYTGESELYKEMQKAVEEMKNGVSEIDAYTNFGSRCFSSEIKKFISTIIQGVVKGSSELSVMIRQQSREIWETKKQRVKQQGEKAASALLIPICIMFIGILIMIIVPIFANIG